MTYDTVRILGVAATLLILAGVGCSAALFQGRHQERYSMLNHFISELGERGVSRAAWVFNGSLILGGLALLPFNIGLGLQFNSVLGWLGAAAGIITVLGVAAVGLFPMDNMQSHIIAAMTYFRGGLLMVILYGLAIFFQPAGSVKIPLLVNIFSLLSVAAYSAFLLRMRRKPEKQPESDQLAPLKQPDRPRVWRMAVMEWAVFFSTMLWLLSITVLTA